VIAIPTRMAHLPLDRRGYAIPWGVYVDGAGRPQFTINDDVKREVALARDLCPICGNGLSRGRWFVGGPMSAFHDRGAYIDMPMHDECAHYALKVCPYLAVPSWRKALAESHIKAVKAAIVAIDPTMIDDRPGVFVAVMTVGQKMTGGNGLQNYVRPARPYRKVEYWRHGERLDDVEGNRLAMQSMESTDA
jgi:hypothetical protein